MKPRSASGLAFAAVTIALAFPAKADAPAKVQLFERSQQVCKTIVLTSAETASTFVRADAGSLSDVCECAALLAVAPLSQADAEAIVNGDKAKAAGLVESVRNELGECVKMAPAR